MAESIHTTPQPQPGDGDMTPEGSDAVTPTPVTVYGDDAVILGRTEHGMLDLYRHGYGLQAYHSDIPTESVTDLDRQRHLLTQALTVVNDKRVEHRQQLVRERARHAAELAEIRQYAIDRYEDSDICREGLDRFLDKFDMDPHRVRVQVHYTINGSLTVEADDEEAIVADVRTYLTVDTGGIDNVEDGSETDTITALRTERL